MLVLELRRSGQGRKGSNKGNKQWLKGLQTARLPHIVQVVHCPCLPWQIQPLSEGSEVLYKDRFTVIFPLDTAFLAE